MLEQVFWHNLWPHVGHTLDQSVPEGLHPVERTCAWAVCEELQPVGGTRAVEVHGGLCPMGGIPHWSRGRLWGGRSGRDNAWWTYWNPHFLSPCTNQGEQVENSGVKLSPEIRKVWGEGVLNFVLISYYPILIWLVIKLILPTEDCCLWQWLSDLPVLIFIIFFPPVQLRRGVQSSLVGTWWLARVNLPHCVLGEIKFHYCTAE